MDQRLPIIQLPSSTLIRSQQPSSTLIRIQTQSLPVPSSRASVHAPLSPITKIQTQAMNKSTKIKQILTWEGMFGNFLGFFKTKQLFPNGQSTPIQIQEKKPKIYRDPIETYSPIDQINQFAIDPKLREKFRQYLDGEKDCQELVQECNHQKTYITKFLKAKKQMKKFQQLHLRASNAGSDGESQDSRGGGEKSSFKFLHLLGIKDQDFKKKIRIQKRYDIIRKLIQHNMTIRQSQKNELNYKDIKLFQSVNQAYEEKKQQIQNKDILSNNLDQNFHENKLNKILGGGLRVKNAKSIGSLSTLNQISDEKRSGIMTQRQEVKSHGDIYLTALHEVKYKQDQLAKRKVKLNIIQHRKQEAAAQQSSSLSQTKISPKQATFVEFEKQNGATSKISKEPFLKDIQLFSYLHGQLKVKGDTEKPLPLIKGNIFNQKITPRHHQLANFKIKSEISNANSGSDDSSLASIMEGKISELYLTTHQVQNRISSEKNEKFIRRMKQIEKVQALTQNAIKQNNIKLYTDKRQN